MNKRSLYANNFHLKNFQYDDTKLVPLFLEWAKQRVDIFEKPIIRQLSIDGKSIFRCTIKVNSKFIYGIENIYGTGRAELASKSLVKACSEAIERIAMVLYKRKELDCKRFSFFQDYTGALCESANIDDWTDVPNELITSNGWAAHFDPNQALKNSIREAFERHILQYSFYKKGWAGFNKIGESEENSFMQSFFLSKFSFFYLAAGLVRSKSNRHPGHSYGYMTEAVENLGGESEWLRATLEAIEPLYFYDEMSREAISSIASDSKDFLEKRQMRYLLEEDDSKIRMVKKDLSHTIVKEVRWPLNQKIFCIQSNLKDILSTPFDFFANFSFSPALFTLFSESSNNDLSKEWLLKTFEMYNLDRSSFSAVPVY